MRAFSADDQRGSRAMAPRGLCPKKVSGTVRIVVLAAAYTIPRVPDTFFGQSPPRELTLAAADRSMPGVTGPSLAFGSDQPGMKREIVRLQRCKSRDRSDPATLLVSPSPCLLVFLHPPSGINGTPAPDPLALFQPLTGGGWRGQSGKSQAGRRCRTSVRASSADDRRGRRAMAPRELALAAADRSMPAPANDRTAIGLGCDVVGACFSKRLAVC